MEGGGISLEAISLSRADGFQVQPDHVFFAHGCDECCGSPHPSWTFDALAADPYRANPYRANPYRANPYRANPYRANPYRANPHEAYLQTSSAIPAAAREFPPRDLDGPGTHPRIAVIDTGLAAGPQLPDLLGNPGASSTDQAATPTVPTTTSSTPRGSPGRATTGSTPWPGTAPSSPASSSSSRPDAPFRFCTRSAGSARRSRACVIQKVQDLAALPDGDRPDILSLSFGGNALAGAPGLRSAIATAQLAGIVVVASAGNDGTSQAQYPAAYDGVIAVGALGPDGPTPWTNYGEWVDACAPGADLVSSFFASFDGPDTPREHGRSRQVRGLGDLERDIVRRPCRGGCDRPGNGARGMQRKASGQPRRLRAECAPHPLPRHRRQRLSRPCVRPRARETLDGPRTRG